MITDLKYILYLVLTLDLNASYLIIIIITLTIIKVLLMTEKVYEYAQYII